MHSLVTKATTGVTFFFLKHIFGSPPAIRHIHVNIFSIQPIDNCLMCIIVFKQVYVYAPNTYKVIKERLKSKGLAQISNQELTGYFSPWYAEHVGKIQSASGNATVESWAQHRLRVKFYFFTFASLLKLHGDTKLLSELNTILGNEALLKLDLKTLAPAFKDSKKRAWFHEVMDNYLKLWEVNMPMST